MAGAAGTETVPTRRLEWRRAVRIVPSRFPPVGLFDDVARPEDLDVVLAVEQMTNPRLREQVGELGLIPAGDRVSGPGTTPIMAAFTHPSPDGSRFSPGWFGVYYAARGEQTAIAETRFHRQRLMRYQDIGPQELHMRAYAGLIRADMLDLRGLDGRFPDLYDPDSYRASQPFGERHRQDGAWGIVYDSVRHAGGQCVAVFRPTACRPVVQAGHFVYYYDGRDITHVARMEIVD